MKFTKSHGLEQELALAFHICSSAQHFQFRHFLGTYQGWAGYSMRELQTFARRSGPGKHSRLIQWFYCDLNT